MPETGPAMPDSSFRAEPEIARSQELTVGAAILTGIKAKLINALEAG